MRQIDADELIRQIESFIERNAITKEDAKISELICELINNAPTVSPALPTEVKKALEVLKVMKQGKWVPVSEKLPPNYILCLFCTADGDIFYGYRNSENLWCEKGRTENISNVIAWQELPQPLVE